MKRIAGIALILCLGISLHAQELSRKEQRKLNRQLKQEQKAEADAQQAILTDLLISRQRFVLEADQLRGRKGDMVNVSSMINFITCDSLRGVIQVGSQAYVGLNGVGGITVEGNVVNYEFTRNEKNGSYMVTYTLKTTTGTYDVRMSVTPLGRADATVSSMWPGSLSYLGNLVAPANSRTHKGMPTY